MLWPHVLVAYDGSDLAQKSLDKALQLLQEKAAFKVDVVYVTEVPDLKHSNEKVDEVIQFQEDKILNELEEKLAAHSDRTKIIQLQGMEISGSILKQSKECAYDLIIMGSRGLTGISEFMGSVSHSVVQRSEVPVLIVK